LGPVSGLRRGGRSWWAWLYLGFHINFIHGRQHSRPQREAGASYGSPWNDAFSNAMHMVAVVATYLGAMEALLAVWTAWALVCNVRPGVARNQRVIAAFLRACSSR